MDAEQQQGSPDERNAHSSKCHGGTLIKQRSENMTSGLAGMFAYCPGGQGSERRFALPGLVDDHLHIVVHEAYGCSFFEPSMLRVVGVPPH